MTKHIDPPRLREAAEQLEVVLMTYPDSKDVHSLLTALQPLIEDAKAGRIAAPIDPIEVPGAYLFGEGRYGEYRTPSVGEAYSRFTAELKGGRSERELRIIERLAARRMAQDIVRGRI